MCDKAPRIFSLLFDRFCHYYVSLYVCLSVKCENAAGKPTKTHNTTLSSMSFDVTVLQAVEAFERQVLASPREDIHDIIKSQKCPGKEDNRV